MKKKEGKSIPFKNLLLGHESTDSVYGLLVYSLHGPSEKPAWFILSCPCICADKGGCLLTSFLQSPKKLLHTQVMSHWKVKLLSCNDLSWLKMRRIFHIVRTWLSMKCASQKLSDAILHELRSLSFHVGFNIAEQCRSNPENTPNLQLCCK